ncbi:MAG: MFS transporter [Oscillospiraceae bacterium]|nr:MFS transporter [Oscillospiraceae bacterium]
MNRNYRRTFVACCMGFVTQAIAANFVPLLYLTFHTQYKIPLGQIALISSVLFMTQLVVDILCVYLADRIGYRRCVIGSQLLSAAGLFGLAFLPELFPDPLIGLIASTVIYAAGSGLTEVLCSPIVEACPSEHKEAVMSLLHSFYCWGSVGVILLSTLFLSVFGTESWKLLACIWAVIPLLNIYNFAVCPIEPPVQNGKAMKVGNLLKMPLFWLAILLMICAGASELSMAQWASAFAEKSLGFSKSTGDLAGPCLFALTMGVSRAIYGKCGERLDLMKFMTFSGCLCLLCYLVASLSGAPMLGLLSCVICGFSVGVMWPGSISICAEKIPTGGTAMFALLAMAGDIGGAIGPGLVGNIAQMAGDSIQAGLLVGSVFPLLLVVSVVILKILQRG